MWLGAPPGPDLAEHPEEHLSISRVRARRVMDLQARNRHRWRFAVRPRCRRPGEPQGALSACFPPLGGGPNKLLVLAVVRPAEEAGADMALLVGEQHDVAGGGAAVAQVAGLWSASHGVFFLVVIGLSGAPLPRVDPLGPMLKTHWVRYGEGVDPADIARAQRLKSAWDEAEKTAQTRRDEFTAFIAELYARKQLGDVSELAQALGRSTKQVKRWAEGQTTGNR